MKKTIVFDFDDTITTFDTIYPFFKFCDKSGFFIKNLKKLLWYILVLMHRVKILSNYKLKEIGVMLFLDGYTLVQIEELSSKFLHKITYHDNVLEEFHRHIEAGNNVVISSASFYEYLSKFSAQYENVKLLSSKLKYVDGKIRGLKFNNYGKNKQIYFSDNNIKIDKLYTDSFSDRYLAQIAKEIVVVTKNSQMIHLNSYEQFLNFFIKKGKYE